MADHVAGETQPENERKRKPYSPETMFKKKLVQEVRRKLQKAGESFDAKVNRQSLLRQLFTDIALEIDNRAQGLLSGETRELEPPSFQGGGKSSVCFYELLADHYNQNTADGDELVVLFQPLWSLSFTSNLFALLMHKWLFKAASGHAENYRRYFRAFINGLGNVLWIDVQSNSKRFKSLYTFAAEQLIGNIELSAAYTYEVQRDLAHMVCGFFFFYEPASSLTQFIPQLPLSLSTQFLGGPADIFATELTNQLQKIKIEPVLVHYLESCQAVHGLELRTITSIRLQVALYALASPGGPLFPSAAVKRAAKSSLDHLFPVGRRFRNVIGFTFRVLHPAFWPTSCWAMVVYLWLRVSGWMGGMPRNRVHNHRD